MKHLIVSLAAVACLVAGLKFLGRKMDERDELLMTDLEEAGMGMDSAWNAEARPLAVMTLPLATTRIQ